MSARTSVNLRVTRRTHSTVRRGFGGLLLGLLLLGLASCSISQPKIPLDRFLSGDIPAVADFARKEATSGPVENQALLFNVLAQCELLMGNADAAWKYFGSAARIMGNWQVSGEIGRAHV